MEEKENYGFCPACGANLPENSSFCPECGHSINAAGGGSEQPGYSGAGYGYSRSPQTYLVGKLKVAFIFVIIYAVMSILGSFYLLMINDAMLDQMETALEVMIDHRYQKRGYGRDAMKLLYDYILTFPDGEEKVWSTSYVEGNDIASKMYRDLGFEENGEKDGDEIVLVLNL